MLKKVSKLNSYLIGFGFIALAVFFAAPKALAATLSISPVTGNFTVGSTFDALVFVNTEGKAINAIEASISFPPDKLQLVSPSAGKSVIGVWTAQPSVDNQIGKVNLQGGIPGGLNVSSGLVTTLTFRVKSVGTATLRFLDSSRVLLHDGRGTNALVNTTSGIYQLSLPPPAGPVVVSATHPDQSVWYKTVNASLSWSGDSQVEGYSFELSDDPGSIPDDVVDSTKTSVSYRNLASGTHFFHIKALREGNFGGITHFALKIDSEPPADFPLKIIPSERTNRKQPIFEFNTTDGESGIDHYEIKIFSVSQSGGKAPLFIEVTSPYVPEELNFGDYAAIVRVYDNAGNVREVTKKFSIVNSVFGIIGGKGLQITSRYYLPWGLFGLICLLILLLLAFFARRIRAKHRRLEESRVGNALPEDIQKQLEDLQQYRKRYGLLVLLMAFMAWGAFGHIRPAVAADLLSAPVISEFSGHISNKEIFYIGGNVEIPETEIVIYLQNNETQETFTYEAQADKKGEWFYRHGSFLPSGRYTVWVQAKLAGQSSAPSPQNEIIVQRQAWEIGSSRLSYEFLYLLLVLVFLLAFLSTLAYLFYHSYHLRKKQKLLNSELRAAEESIKRGFAIIRRDVEAELKLIKHAKAKSALSAEQQQKEAQLMTDLNELEKRLGREIWEIEQLES